MSEILYPTGYGTKEVTLSELWTIHGPKMHPEFARRLFALIEAGKGVIGIGNSWRSTEQQAANYARDPRGFARPGSSFHEYQVFASGVRGINAVDTVGTDLDDDGTRESAEHREAWNFLKANAGRFGLAEFSDVNGEPWHAQCADIPLAVSDWKRRGSPDPVAGFALPDGSSILTSAPAPVSTPSAPSSTTTGRFVTVNVSLRELSRSTPKGSSAVKQLQTLISLKDPNRSLTVDGHFGPKTEEAVRAWQGFFGLGVDGVVGPKTWKLVVELEP